MMLERRYIWNAADGSFVKKLEGHKAAVSCCSWSELDMLITGQQPAAPSPLAFVNVLQAIDRKILLCGVSD